jgi:protein gp37
MSQNSKIEWTTHTFNPWWGCTKISPACKNCYADDRKAKAAGERHRVFCASFADVMEDRRDLDEHRTRLCRLIDATPNLDWLLLTKRPENYSRFLPTLWLEHPRPNVWLGTTAENQHYANERIPHLLQTPAAVRFVSYEPALGPVNFRRIEHNPGGSGGPVFIDALKGQFVSLGSNGSIPYVGLNWIICGGESGPGARPMHPDWARSVRDQCQAAGVAYLFKQWGEYVESRPRGEAAKRMTADPIFGGLQMIRVGKAKAGRLLDGREWNEFPAVSA